MGAGVEREDIPDEGLDLALFVVVILVIIK
jgi:hypothetical protein